MQLTPEHFTAMYRRHAQTLLLYFQRRLHDGELARDLLAETFESAIRAGSSFRGTSENELSGWLWAIARNALAEQRRREEGERARSRRLGRQRNALSDREIERIEELAGIAQLREAVAMRLSELPAEQREAVRLRVVEDLPYEQVALSMGVSRDTARARVSRGLRALNLALEREHGAWRQG